MDINLLSTRYDVRKIEEKDVFSVFQLCEKNPQYYHYCPPAVSVDGLKADLKELPPGKTMDDKYYVGFYDHNELVAVMDLVLGYPNERIAFIGFFMMAAKFQGKSIGSKIIKEVCEYLRNDFSFVRLGYVKGNRQSEHFWIKNLFEFTGNERKTDNYDIVVMQRKL